MYGYLAEFGWLGQSAAEQQPVVIGLGDVALRGPFLRCADGFQGCCQARERGVELHPVRNGKPDFTGNVRFLPKNRKRLEVVG
jgi:hypothetical protein